MNSIVGALIEAWQELRIHKLRVLLSLIGVAVSVAAMTGVAALITTTDQVQRESMERMNGREGSVMVYLWDETGDDPVAAMRNVTTQFGEFIERNEIRYASRNTWSQAVFTGGGQPAYSELLIVDQPYGVMRRVPILEGSWFTSNTDDRLAPPVVVNEAFLQYSGMVGTPPPFTMEMSLAEGKIRNTVVVTGVVPDQWEWDSPRAYLLNSSYLGVLDRAATPGVTFEVGTPELEMWVGPALVHEAERAARSGLPGADAMIQDYSWLEENSRIMGLVGFSITGLVLGLAALNLLTISMVTLHQRIREIGIRRAFGASSGRVFFAVMMESVVATLLAGAFGVLCAAIAFNHLPVDEWLTGMRLQDAIPFPAEAALLGLVVAAGVGALAGLVPALVAVRIRPIDAIRF